jgi:dCTP deaminase
MILSAQTIRRLSIQGMVMPFREHFHDQLGNSGGLGPCGYDVTLEKELVIKPGDFVLAATTEHFCLPHDVMFVVHDKSTWIRSGIAVHNTVAEPGWRGFLTLEIAHHGSAPVTMPAGCSIAQIVFHMLDEPTEQAYSGKYQDQAAGPQPSRWYSDPTPTVPEGTDA